MSLNELLELSHRYGKDMSYVIAGGGNTSWKNEELMYVKASGTELATIGGEGFVKMNLSRLDEIWGREYSENSEEREEQVLADMMASRFPSEEGKRPSVESLLHALIPYTYVVHTHPALVNALTCSREGEKVVEELFGKQAVWIPVTDPGYILAKYISDKVTRHMDEGLEFPRIIFLQNHGVFVSGSSVEEIDKTYKSIFEKIDGKLKKDTVPVAEVSPLDPSLVDEAREILNPLMGGELTVLGFVNQDILDFAGSVESFEPLSLSFTPDHIVYYGFKPVYTESMKGLAGAVTAYIDENKVNPRLAVIKDVGAFSFNTSESMAEKGKLLFIDDVNIAVYVKSFGGHLFMPTENIDFIRNWEVEKYRASLSK